MLSPPNSGNIPPSRPRRATIIPSPRPTFRFAPSPNGHLHLGHAYSALLNADLARRRDGRLLLRIEDIDITRCRPAFVADLLEDLAWLGLTFDGPPRRQSEHFADYAAVLGRLTAKGLTYASLASRKEIAAAVAALEAAGAWPRDPDGAPLHPRAALPDDADGARLAAGEPHALRLDMARARALAPPLAWTEQDPDGTPRTVPADPGRWGDVVLARKEFPASYHIAVVVDDALQGVTDVVRGQDLYEATAVHRLLQHLLGLPAPAYRHHGLIRGGDGEKLSKSLASRSLRAFRAEGATPADIRRLVGLADVAG
ncbi:glutamyl-Q tRNA(Asp) synthetase [Labrys wisconsinensis]|uniref:Glutamyl-Q tRNA(Asp) synthetase n=1 Tax=Labrys wisconsinensis TaxID=425677 RepID=A0ABU0J0Q6_9HYPH|nr:glutamyl-Q tRNA(Asp) synthetase [Labrys wisconsinensis]